MNNKKIKNNKSNNKSINNKNTKISKKRKQPKFKKNTTIIVLYLTSLVFYIVTFFTLRLIHVKNNNNFFNQISTGNENVFSLINNTINNIINNTINNLLKTELNEKYFNLNGFMSYEVKFGFNYMSVIIYYKIIDKENVDNIDIKKVSDIEKIQGNDNCYVINGSSKINIKYNDIITQNNLDIKKITNQFINNIYEKIIINIFIYINKKLFNKSDFENEDSKCLYLRAKQINVTIDKCNKIVGIINGFIDENIKLVDNNDIEKEKNKLYKDINDKIHSFYNKFIKGINNNNNCKDGEYYIDIKNDISSSIKRIKDPLLEIINYFKISRISIISLLGLVIILKLIQIKTKSKIVTNFYHIFSYISLIIFLVLSITLFIPKKILSQQKYTKKITKNLKFIVNIENILMFVGAIILILIKVIEIIF